MQTGHRRGRPWSHALAPPSPVSSPPHPLHGASNDAGICYWYFSDVVFSDDAFGTPLAPLHPQAWMNGAVGDSSIDVLAGGSRVRAAGCLTVPPRDHLTICLFSRLIHFDRTNISTRQ
jgi:hypothetical protein